MTQENKTILVNRLKSFAWRLGSMVGIAIIAFIMDNIGLLDLPVWTVTIIGLIGGEVTKFLNTKTI